MSILSLVGKAPLDPTHWPSAVTTPSRTQECEHQARDVIHESLAVSHCWFVLTGGYIPKERVEHHDSRLQGVVGTDRKHGYDLNDGDILEEDGSHVGLQAGDDGVHDSVGRILNGKTIAWDLEKPGQVKYHGGAGLLY
jgi:hypothetical protein